jgi:mono/diheme cytochrome c family protein
MARVSFDRMYSAIKEGIPGTAMAPWNIVLSDMQMGAVIDYIRTLAPRSARSAPYAASLELGRRLYRRGCVVCHGDDGRADTQAARMLDPPPTNFSDPVAMARVDDGRMYLAITKGRPGTAMSSWEHAMVPAEIIDIMRYVRTLEQPLPGNMSQLDLDLTVGENIYTRHCVECHGKGGDGRTSLTEALGQYPRDFSDAEAMRAAPEDVLRQTIIHGKPGTAMAPWRGILNEDDIRRVIFYIRRTFQRSP